MRRLLESSQLEFVILGGKLVLNLTRSDQIVHELVLFLLLLRDVNVGFVLFQRLRHLFGAISCSQVVIYVLSSNQLVDSWNPLARFNFLHVGASVSEDLVQWHLKWVGQSFNVLFTHLFLNQRKQHLFVLMQSAIQ